MACTEIDFCLFDAPHKFLCKLRLNIVFRDLPLIDNPHLDSRNHQRDIITHHKIGYKSKKQFSRAKMAGVIHARSDNMIQSLAKYQHFLQAASLNHFRDNEITIGGRSAHDSNTPIAVSIASSATMVRSKSILLGWAVHRYSLGPHFLFSSFCPVLLALVAQPSENTSRCHGLRRRRHPGHSSQ